MNFFLEEIALHILKTYSNRLQNCCIVFPNRRAGLFFNKYLSRQITNPVWSPTIYTINDLMIRFSDLAQADDLDILFDLYEIYCDVRKINESFDDFYFWGEMMMADFDDVDKYLINARDLFQNVSALKSLEDKFDYLTKEQLDVIQRFWKSFRLKRGNGHEREFIDIWQALFSIYTQLRERLMNKSLGYEGMIYRNVIDSKVMSGKLMVPFEKVIFVGFNALNECEKKLFKFLSNGDKADFFWDYDDYYVQNESHEAGRFIRKNVKEFTSPDASISFDNLRKKKDIRIISVPSDIGQAKILPELLTNNDSSPETAVVLSDENLVMPVLHSLPESVNDVNITMGYPVHETPVFSFIQHIFNLQNNCRKFKNNSWCFYHKNVLSILNHPYIQNQYINDSESLKENILQLNLAYVPPEDLHKNGLFQVIFTRLDDSNRIPDYLLQVLDHIMREGLTQEAENNSIEIECIYQIYLRIKRFKDILDKRNISFLPITFYRLLRKILIKTRIPFTGEPLSGLQIMGVLETRALDFRKVIVLSMNEGIFPKASVSHSFIPHNLRYGFNLPTLEHQDAIYAYYFYRLIQRAEEVILVYNNKTEGMQTGEKSRYLHQLLLNPLFNPEKRIVSFNIISGAEHPIEIHKSQPVIEILKKYTDEYESDDKRYLSPSALNTYLDCTLKFYFRYITGIDEPEKVYEEVDPLLLGNLLHRAINEIYKHVKDKLISEEKVNALHSDHEGIEKSIIQAFKDEDLLLSGVDQHAVPGKYIIIKEILHRYVKQILLTDKKYTPFEIIGLENKYDLECIILGNGPEFKVRIGGTIDRIDKIKDTIRIIDYKTGTVQKGIEQISDLFDRESSKRNSAVFQILLYSKLYAESFPEDQVRICPGLYPIKDIVNPTFEYHILIGPPRKKEKLSEFRAVDAEFSANLNSTISEIFNNDVQFTQTKQRDKCEYCTYKEICHR